MQVNDSFNRMQYAFPQALRTEVMGMFARWDLQPTEYKPNGVYSVNYAGEVLEIPTRLYLRRGEWLSWIEDDDTTQRYKTFSWCLGSRDHDGFYRESCVRKLLGCGEPWVVPFVIAPLGEYVIEIIQAIQQALPTLHRTHYGNFVAENPAYMALTQQRIASYWDCYFRARYPKLNDSPARMVWHELQAMGAEACKR
jgi:hypothetical protein